MPRAILGHAPVVEQPRKTVPIFAIPFVLTGAALLAFVATGLGDRKFTGNNLIPNTGQQPVTQTAWQFLTGETPASPAKEETIQPAAQANLPVCPLPDGWVRYTVTPTDTLFRLSVLYSISVAELQSANCLGDETLLMPGDVIYVPVRPTLAPSLTPSRVFRPLVTVVSNSEDDNDEPRPPADTATSVPPTAISPTGEPVKPSDPPPAKEDKKDDKKDEKKDKGKGDEKKDENKGKGKK